MADQFLDQLRELAEGQIDFEGQRLVEFLITALLATVGVVAFIIGAFKQDIKLALYTGLGGAALTCALVIPPWSFFNRHPVKWLPVKSNKVSSEDILVDGEHVG